MSSHTLARKREELEKKGAEELFALTLAGEYDDDIAWEVISVLRLRGTSEVFAVAKRYCDSEDKKARARGLSVLSQLGAGKPDAERPFISESVSIAIDHLGDSDIEVVRCAAWALSHLGTVRGVSALMGMNDHHDSEVRQAVACCHEMRRYPEGIAKLLHLMDDRNDVVRDWATFAIGTEEQYEERGKYIDSQEIRVALHKRCNDPYEDARREAVWGLARRNDRDGIKLLINALESSEPWTGDYDTAQEILGLDTDIPKENLIERLGFLLSDNAS